MATRPSPAPASAGPTHTTERGIFCNRTLNLRSIKAVGYDMDYTLIHYHVEEWERRAYEHLKQRLVLAGWPIAHLEFDPEQVCRGLIIDTQRGNLLKANRFGFVKRASHGTQMMSFDTQQEVYSRTIVDLNERHYVFINTLFSLSEGCMYAQLVDLLDQKKLPEVLGYGDLYSRVRNTLDTAHMEGQLKAEIIADPGRFIELDSETALTLMDQRKSGKKLLLITNSEWAYTGAIMSYAFDRFLPKGDTWRTLFDLIIVSARKPDFFTTSNPFFEIATEDGLLRPSVGQLQNGKAYLGGSARQLEKHLGLSGDEILYVGDHMFGDVKVTKNVLRWRTALVLREIEEEMCAVEAFRHDEARLETLMMEKEVLENQICQIRLQLQRQKGGYGPSSTEAAPNPEVGTSPLDDSALQSEWNSLKEKLHTLDQQIGPLARAATELNHPTWGLLMRAGNDKSHLARQMERYADIYTSRVSNFLYYTPFVYFRSPRGSLPHDPAWAVTAGISHGRA